MFESGHLTLVSGAGEGEVVSKKVGKEVRGAQGGVARRSDNATSESVDVKIDLRTWSFRPTVTVRPPGRESAQRGT